MSKVLIRKQQGIQYQQVIEAPKQRSSLGRDLATLGGGAVGLTPQGGQGFVSGQGQAGRPTRMQRLGAGANLAGRGLAAALTGLQTAHSLQGGNVGAIASARDQYRANVSGLTGGQPTEMQRTQDMATEMYNTQEQERLQQQIRDAAQQQMASQVPAGMPPQRQENVPLPTSMPNPNSAGPSRVAINPPQQLTGPPVSTPSQTIDDPTLPPPEGPIPLPTTPAAQTVAQPAAPGISPIDAAATLPQPAPGMFQQPTPPAPAPAPAPVAPAPAPAPAPVAPAPAPAPVEKPVKNDWTEQESWFNEKPMLEDNRPVNNAGKTALLRPIKPMNKDNYSTGWDLTSEEIQRQEEFDARQQEARYQPRELTPSPGARPKSTHRGTFIRTVKPVPMNIDRPVVVKPPVNTGGMGSNPMEDAKIPSLKDNPLFTGSGKDFGVPAGSNQERLNRIASDEAFDSAYGQQEGEAWRRRHGGFKYKSFTQMIFNEFGDMLRKADPHVAGLLAMRVYMDKFMR